MGKGFFKTWFQGYLRGSFSFIFTLLIVGLVVWVQDYKIEPIDTIKFYLARFVAVTKPVRVTLGSCYPFQYGLDLDNRTMHFYPIPTDKAIKFPGAGTVLRLDLAVKNDEKLLTLERGRLSLTFPPRATMVDEHHVPLYDMKKKKSPWICLGTGNTSCYTNFSYLYPGDGQCLYPIFVSFPETARGKTMAITYKVNAKDQQPKEGKLLLKIE